MYVPVTSAVHMFVLGLLIGSAITRILAVWPDLQQVSAALLVSTVLMVANNIIWKMHRRSRSRP